MLQKEAIDLLLCILCQIEDLNSLWSVGFFLIKAIDWCLYHKNLCILMYLKKKRLRGQTVLFKSCTMNVYFLLLSNMLLETFDGTIPKQLRYYKTFPGWGTNFSCKSCDVQGA